MQNKINQVLCSLTVNPEYIEFAIPELKALLNKIPIPLQKLLQYQLKQTKPFPQCHQLNHQSFKYFPFVVLNVPNFQDHRHLFQDLCTNAVMVQKVIQLISMGKNYQQLLANRDEDILKEFCRNQGDAVLCDFESKNRMTPRQNQVQKIHRVLGGLDVRGHVNFKQPKIRYQLIQQHDWYQGHHKLDPSQTLKQVYFGIELSTNKIATAKFNQKYQLSNRIYLGPTSADNDLAFLMCNQALVQQGSLVIDPFVGTAGLLIPPASKKALTFGSDLDIRVLNGYSVGRINKKSSYYNEEKKFQLFTPKIMLNFQQYNIQPPNIIRIDSTKLTLRGQQFFDAIITDPPYGIRAMSRSVIKKNQQQSHIKQDTNIQKTEVEEQEQTMNNLNKKQEGKYSDEQQQLSAEQRLKKQQKRRKLRQNKKKRKEDLPEQQKQFKASLLKKLNRQRVDNWQKFDRTKIQTTQREIIFESLLKFALKHLRKGGRLVFLYPVYEEQEYLGAKSLPKHQGFKLIDLSRNMMAKGNSRILVTLQKLP